MWFYDSAFEAVIGGVAIAGNFTGMAVITLI